MKDINEKRRVRLARKRLLQTLNQIAMRNLGKALVSFFVMALCETLCISVLCAPLYMRLVAGIVGMGNNLAGGAATAIPINSALVLAVLLLFASFVVWALFQYGFAVLLLRMVRGDYVTLGYIFYGWRTLRRSAPCAVFFAAVFTLLTAAGSWALVRFTPLPDALARAQAARMAAVLAPRAEVADGAREADDGFVVQEAAAGAKSAAVAEALAGAGDGVTLQNDAEVANSAAAAEATAGAGDGVTLQNGATAANSATVAETGAGAGSGAELQNDAEVANSAAAAEATAGTSGDIDSQNAAAPSASAVSPADLAPLPARAVLATAAVLAVIAVVACAALLQLAFLFQVAYDSAEPSLRSALKADFRLLRRNRLRLVRLMLAAGGRFLVITALTVLLELVLSAVTAENELSFAKLVLNFIYLVNGYTALLRMYFAVPVLYENARKPAVSVLVDDSAERDADNAVISETIALLEHGAPSDDGASAENSSADSADATAADAGTDERR